MNGNSICCILNLSDCGRRERRRRAYSELVVVPVIRIDAVSFSSMRIPFSRDVYAWLSKSISHFFNKSLSVDVYPAIGWHQLGASKS